MDRQMLRSHQWPSRGLLKTRLGAGVAVALLISLPSCGGNQGSEAEGSSASSAAAGPADIPAVLATVEGEDITMEDVRARIGENLEAMDMRYRRERHTAIQNTLDQILQERVLLEEARSKNMTVDELVEEAAGGALDPSDEEISAFYEANRSRMGGRTLDQIRPQIAQFLRTQRSQQAARALQDSLSEAKGVRVLLDRFRLEFANEGAPALGPADAPVTLVEFSDFECPYCGQFFPTVKRLESNYGDRLRIIYRQFPLPSLHPNAFKAAEASLCAHEQDRFWDMHDLLFTEQDRLTVRDLKEKAGRLGLDQAEFDACLDTSRYVEQIQEDQREGRLAGINGTPALFLNGIPVEGGAVSYDVAAAAIEAELERVGG
jgi:predicted DsbA family dithiol-disulfide isomerase